MSQQDKDHRAFIQQKLDDIKRRQAQKSLQIKEEPPESSPAAPAARVPENGQKAQGAPANISVKREPHSRKRSSNSQTTPTTTSKTAQPNDNRQNVFSNDGSFLEQFKRMQKLKIELVKKDRIIDKTEAQIKLEEESAGDVSAPQTLSAERQAVIERLAISVVVNGKSVEDQAKNSESMKMMLEKDSNEMDFYNDRLKALSAAKERAEQSGALPLVREEVDREAKRQKRKSRWGDWPEEKARDPSLMAYAQQVYGSTSISDDQWKQLEDQRKMRAIFEMMQAKKAQVSSLQAAGKVKYEYDSDEEVEGGTWEHKRRALEMEKTRMTAEKLTDGASGKHHLGDFLPPEELDKFMERYENLRNGQSVDFGNYEENKLKEDNVGFKMLQKMGWAEGQGLGASGSGITAPIESKGNDEKTGLGTVKVDQLSAQDDEYDAYRKRMMLAYRFRPNPLNNPRRSYY